LSIGVFRQTHSARLANPFQPRRNVHALTHQVAVTLLDNFAEVNADPKFDLPIRLHARVAFNEALLHFNRTADGVDHAAELDDRAVAGALHYAPVMRGYRGVDEVAAEFPQARQRSVLVGSCKPRVADHVGDQDRRQLRVSPTALAVSRCPDEASW
jgi:hypothetical protein